MQFALRGDFGIELAQAACGGVARVGERLLAGFELALVQRGKIGFEHQHFAAHFQLFRLLFAAQFQRDIAYGFDVFGYVFARGAVAARGRLHQNPVLIQQADGQPVKLRLGGVFHLRHAQFFAHALVKRQKFGVVERARFVVARRKRVVQRQHRHGVHHGFKAVQHRAAHPLRGAFGQPELRIFGFQGFQLAVEPVVFGIGHAGRVQSVVFVGVAVERLHEGADAVLGRGHGAGCLRVGKTRLYQIRLAGGGSLHPFRASIATLHAIFPTP